MLEKADAARQHGVAQRRHDQPRVDLVVVGAEQAGGDRGSQPRFHRPHLRAAEPACRKAAAHMEIVTEPQPLDLVAAERHHQRAAVAEIDGKAGLGLQGAAECGPHALAFQRQCQELRIARLMLGGRREHAGGGEARACPGAGAVEYRDGEPALGQPPCDRQPDHAGADYGDIDGGRDSGRPTCGRRRWRCERAHGRRRQYGRRRCRPESL